MSHHLSTIHAASVETGQLLDYAFVTDEEFLLVVALTTKANVIIHNKTNVTRRVEVVSLFDIYENIANPVLITITSDASVVIIVQSDNSVILIPIKCLLNVIWGASNPICAEPISFPVQTGSESDDSLPTAVVCFKSEHTLVNYIVYGTKGGAINIVDLHLRRLVATISTNAAIERLEICRADEKKDVYLVLTKFTGEQAIIILESNEMPLRENLAHLIPDHDVVPYEEHTLTTLNHKHVPTIFNGEKEKLYILENIKNRVPVDSFNIPTGTCTTFFSPRLIVAVRADGIFTAYPFFNKCEFKCVVDDYKLSVIGFIPIIRSDVSALDECVVISSNGVYVLTPSVPLPQAVLNLLITESFAKDCFTQLCQKTGKQPWNLFEVILRNAAQSEPHDEATIHGLIYLGLDAGFNLSAIWNLFCELGQYDAIIPYLRIRSERNPEDVSARNLLFDALMKKLLTGRMQVDQRKSLEEDIRQFLLKFDAGPESVEALLKTGLLKCANLLLSRYRATLTPLFVQFFLENGDWRSFGAFEVIRSLNSLHWPVVENGQRKALYKQMFALASSSEDIKELMLLAGFAEREMRTEMHLTTPLFIYTSLWCLNALSSVSLSDTETKRWNPIICGSNHIAVVSDEARLLGWGEFRSGSRKARNVDAEKNRNQNPQRYLSNFTLFGLTKLPKEIPLPSVITNDFLGISSIAAGTEHILILTAYGKVFTYGRNRYGQCGVGHCDPVTEVVEIRGDFSRIRSVYAGHYHSALLDEKGRVWMFGWSVHGQLAIPTITNVSKPLRIPSLSAISVAEVSLGMSHSLFLDTNGNVYGCGYMENGELIEDPQNVAECNGRSKSWKILKLNFPEPIRMISSSYFMGTALSDNAIYQWGESPQTLRLNAFFIKQRNAKLREKKNKGSKEAETADEKNEPDAAEAQSSSEVKTEPNEEISPTLPRNHFKLRRICSWDLASKPVRQLCSGHNHFALLTENGELHTWGRGTDRQLGHGTKTDKSVPTVVSDAFFTYWTNVACGWNFTVATSNRGEIFCWGRNDRSQLGVPLPLTAPTCGNNSSPMSTPNTPRRFVLGNRRRAVELTESSCVERPSNVPGIAVPVQRQIILGSQFPNNIERLIQSCDQSTIWSVAAQLRTNPVHSAVAVSVQIFAGDLLHAIQNLSTVYVANRSKLQLEANAFGKSNISQPSTSTQECPPPLSNLIVKCFVGTIELENFERLVDRLWCLVNAHPIEDVKAVAALMMLCAQFPIYSRLSLDPRLCRLVAGHIELPLQNPLSLSASSRKSSSPSHSQHMDPPLSSSEYCTSPTVNRQRMTDMPQKDRVIALKKARLPGPSKILALRTRIEAKAERLDFYANCGHYERRSTSQTRARVAQICSAYRQCSQCIPKNELAFAHNS